MEDNPQNQKPAQPANPTELLSQQAQSLSELVEIQKAQREQITELQHQNERMIGLLVDVNRGDPETGLTYVKIEDVNMPFRALIGFMVKVSLASIPAFLILAMLYGLILLILSLFGIALGGLFGR